MITQRRPIASTTQPVLLGMSAPVLELQKSIDGAARSDAKVLLTGETGAGKEVVARLVHTRSQRASGPFVTINCAGIPDSLLESEFFGHAKGSFTGAYRDNPGLLRQAHRGTVFLDEVGEMSLRMQALLLRFLETGEIQTVGGPVSSTHVDVRVITATNRDLPEAISSREFREDLYYRLNVLHLKIPPLRERSSDVAILIEHYIDIFASQHGVWPPSVSPAAMAMLTGYSWPGNVRELKNVVERLALRVASGVIEPADLPPEITAAGTVRADEPMTMAVSHQARIDAIVNRLFVQKESFWTAAYTAFITRDITRDDLRYIVRAGLEQTRGSYRVLLELFNMPPQDYKRFLGFLKQHDCHLPFQRFRMLKADIDGTPGR
jgi:DNA-binding NtrC family response regulator